VHITLRDREVDIAISLENGAKESRYVGLYAMTPLFEYLGEGEEYADKSFSDVKAFQDGKPLRIVSTQRAFFLGRDISHILRKAGISPLPSNQIDSRKLARLPLQQMNRIDNWQGQVSYGWSARIAPASTAIETVSYRALPQFGLESLVSDKFTQLVQQHCGKPEELRTKVRRAASGATEVMMEVFEFPLPFLKNQDTKVTIEKPTERWQGTREIGALACGLDDVLTIPSTGIVRGANKSISVLVVSLLSDMSKEEDSKQ
jgi:hypothetical protein